MTATHGFKYNFQRLMLFLPFVLFFHRMPMGRPFGSVTLSKQYRHRFTLGMVLEVEQKFRFSHERRLMEKSLQCMGFVQKGSTNTFTDWYFDDPSLSLSLNDCWLRYRETKDGAGQWQLKQGRDCRSASSPSTSTVYEESVGETALELAISMLSRGKHEQTSNTDYGSAWEWNEEDDFDDEDIPNIPMDKSRCLRPYVRLMTHRSSWVLTSTNDNHLGSNDNDHYDLQVDLDVTNTNYAIGEVECVVEREDQVAEAKARIQTVIDQLVSVDNGNKQDPPCGKLEHFLQTQRPGHYKALVEAGVLNCKN